MVKFNNKDFKTTAETRGTTTSSSTTSTPTTTSTTTTTTTSITSTDQIAEEEYEETATCGVRSTASVMSLAGKRRKGRIGGEGIFSQPREWETAPGDWPWMALLRYSDPVW